MVRLLARVMGVGKETVDMQVHEVLSRNLRDRRAVAGQVEEADLCRQAVEEDRPLTDDRRRGRWKEDRMAGRARHLPRCQASCSWSGRFSQ
jgi:hypothetical protein